MRIISRWFKGDEPDPHEERIAEAERKLEDLTERADKVAPALLARKRRNHWGESVDIIWEGRR